MKHRAWITVIVMAASLAAIVPSHAQVSGARPLRIVAPTVPGGGIDVYSRLLAQELAALLGEPVVVENRPGGSTIIGTNHVVMSPPDGRTLLLTTNGYAVLAAVHKSLPFDPFKDLAPVTALGSSPFVIAVNANVPARDLAQLVALSKAPGSKLSYSSCGTATPQHLAGELFKSMTGANMVHIPYKGCAPAIADAVSGQVQVTVTPVQTTLPYVQAGTIRPLSLTTRKRSKLLPNVLSAEEAGLKDYHADQWFAVFVAANTPRQTIDRINAVIAKALKREDLLKRLDVLGIEPEHGTPEELAQLLRSDVERWSKLAKAINLQLD